MRATPILSMVVAVVTALASTAQAAITHQVEADDLGAGGDLGSTVASAGGVTFTASGGNLFNNSTNPGSLGVVGGFASTTFNGAETIQLDFGQTVAPSQLRIAQYGGNDQQVTISGFTADPGATLSNGTVSYANGVLTLTPTSFAAQATLSFGKITHTQTLTLQNANAQASASGVGFGSVSFARNVIFAANFNDSPTTLSPTVANLNAGTPVGSWSFTGAEPGRINAGASGFDKALVFDEGEDGDPPSSRVSGLFSRAHAVAGGPLTVEFLWNQSRGGTNKQVRFSLNSGATRAFVLTWNENTDVLSWVDAANSMHTIADLDAFFLDATANWNPATALRVRLVVTGIDTALLSLVIDNNGDFTGAGDVLDMLIGPRVAGIASLDGFDFFYNSTASPTGMWIDNITVLSVPSPAALPAGLAMLGIIAARRRAA